jgi:hypothetical protein
MQRGKFSREFKLKAGGAAAAAYDSMTDGGMRPPMGGVPVVAVALEELKGQGAFATAVNISMPPIAGQSEATEHSGYHIIFDN